LSPDDQVIPSTLDALSRLTVASGGYERNDDGLSSYDSNEWIFIDLRAASALRRAGRTMRADALVAQVTASANANFDLLPELYNDAASDGPIGAYAGAVPMVGFGAAAYVLALFERAGTSPARDCGDSMGTVGTSDGGQPTPPVRGCSCQLSATRPLGLPGPLLLGALGLLLCGSRFSRRKACAPRARGQAAG
jgi:hypothetical protein